MQRALLFPALALALAACDMPADSADPAADASATAAAADIPAPAGLTSDQRLIWDSMTPTAKAEATQFIADGGTFAEYIAP